MKNKNVDSQNTSSEIEDTKLPGFGEIDLTKVDDTDETKIEPKDVNNPTKSLIGMLLNKKYNTLKTDVEEIVANKIASRIQDKKDELRAVGFRTVGSKKDD